jgi:glycosyltransferase involved in cell wall biosynthesis
MAREAPDIKLDEISRPFPHPSLISRLGSCRYLVSLSPAEGFGLIPLEAMAMGTVVLGFDGFGGREYMRSGQNCLVTTYPDLEGLTHQIIAAVRDQALAERLSKEGRITAQAYTYARFRAAWHDEFRRFLQL